MPPDWVRANPLARLWRRLGITYKFGVAFAALLGLVLVAALVNMAVLSVVQRAEADILASMEISRKVVEMDAGLEKARRLYRDFLLNSPEIGFARAHELYGQPALAATARVIAVNEELRRMIWASNVGETLKRRNVNITLYLSLAKRFASVLLENTALLTTLADPEKGLEARLAARMAALKAELAGIAPFSALIQEADLAEKQYRITRQRPHMQSAFNALARLSLRLADSDLPTETKRRIQDLLNEYSNVADKMLDTDVAIRGNLNDFALQAGIVDPISQELTALAAAEVVRHQGRIAFVSRAALAVILVTTALAVACALAVAFVINSSVTRKIVAMTGRAAEMRSGNLDVTVEAGNGDELGELADTFNAMTHRVKDLVENLEEKVRQRTRELAETNRELDRKNQELEVLSQTDRLTGLFNRRKLDEAMAAELRRAQRYMKAFSVIMLDLDHFKDVNDTFGHPKGDEVLAGVARILSSHARDTDILGRWGGEEFVIVCPETDVDVAVLLAERLRGEIRSFDFPGAGHLTASFGVTGYLPSDDAQAILRRVDQALYKAKRGGRDRVEAV